MNQVCSVRAMVLASYYCSVRVAFAQSDLGSISGFVKDPSGAMIPKAKVTVKNESGLERQATTNESGYYTITNIPPAFYKITVEVAGFKRYESTGNKLDASAALSAGCHADRRRGDRKQSRSRRAPVTANRIGVRDQGFTREQIDSLELNGRNPIFMANLVPGTRGGNLAGHSFNFSQGPSNINGARKPESLITYDGAPAMRTRSNGTSLGAADVDSTSEIQILTAAYSAEYRPLVRRPDPHSDQERRQQFHGAAYEYVRNDVFNANTWSRNHTPGQNFVAPINYNQFGYNIGGPFYIPGKFNNGQEQVVLVLGPGVGSLADHRLPTL